jgi:hypothetical protein
LHVHEARIIFENRQRFVEQPNLASGRSETLQVQVYLNFEVAFLGCGTSGCWKQKQMRDGCGEEAGGVVCEQF